MNGPTPSSRYSDVDWMHQDSNPGHHGRGPTVRPPPQQLIVPCCTCWSPAGRPSWPGRCACRRSEGRASKVWPSSGRSLELHRSWPRPQLKPEVGRARISLHKGYQLGSLPKLPNISTRSLNASLQVLTVVSALRSLFSWLVGQLCQSYLHQALIEAGWEPMLNDLTRR